MFCFLLVLLLADISQSAPINYTTNGDAGQLDSKWTITDRKIIYPTEVNETRLSDQNSTASLTDGNPSFNVTVLEDGIVDEPSGEEPEKKNTVVFVKPANVGTSTVAVEHPNRLNVITISLFGGRTITLNSLDIATAFLLVVIALQLTLCCCCYSHMLRRCRQSAVPIPNAVRAASVVESPPPAASLNCSTQTEVAQSTFLPSPSVCSTSTPGRFNVRHQCVGRSNLTDSTYENVTSHASQEITVWDEVRPVEKPSCAPLPKIPRTISLKTVTEERVEEKQDQEHEEEEEVPSYMWDTTDDSIHSIRSPEVVKYRFGNSPSTGSLDELTAHLHAIGEDKTTDTYTRWKKDIGSCCTSTPIAKTSESSRDARKNGAEVAMPVNAETPIMRSSVENRDELSPLLVTSPSGTVRRLIEAFSGFFSSETPSSSEPNNKSKGLVKKTYL